MSRRQRMIALMGLTISALFLWLAFNKLNPGEVLEYLRTANPALIVFAAFWYFGMVFIISTRWRFLLRPAWSGKSAIEPDPIVEPAPVIPSTNEPPTSLPPVKVPTVPQLAALVCVGYMGNNVFPLRAGEFLRIALTQHDFNIPFARVTTTVLVERILDGIVMLTLILLALVFGGFPLAESIRPVAVFAAPLFIIALSIFFYFALNPDKLHAFSVRILARMPDRIETRVLNLIDDAIDGLEALRTPRDLLGAIVFSYGSWMYEATTYFIVARAFNLPVDYWAMMLLVGVINLAGLIPASPGQFGVYEFFAITILTAIGVVESAAITYAFSLHLVIWLPVTLIGFYVLWRRSLGFNIFKSAQQLERTTAQKSSGI